MPFIRSSLKEIGRPRGLIDLQRGGQLDLEIGRDDAAPLLRSQAGERDLPFLGDGFDPPLDVFPGGDIE